MERLLTFIKLAGSLDERVYQATGLNSTKDLLTAMQNKPKKQAVDFLLPTPCNQACNHCFFTEEEGPANIDITNPLLDELRRLAITFDPELTNLTIYPREITTATSLLPIYIDRKVDRVLTNAVLLSKVAVIDLLKNSGIRRLAISLHGNKDQQSRLTDAPPDFYDKTIAGIKNAIEAGMEVSIFSVIYKDNVNLLDELFSLLNQLKVREVKLIRLIPAGKAKALSPELFLNENDIRNMLISVNTARLRYPNLRIALLGSKFGPNFYSSSIYKYLAGQEDIWPNSTYVCPWIGQEFIGISLGSGKIYPCFEALSFPETQIGFYKDGVIDVAAPPLSAEQLATNLTGICSTDKCEYQPLCLGGCRISAFSFAKQRNEDNPLYAGMDICITKILEEMI